MTYSEALSLAEGPEDVAALMRAARDELEGDWAEWLRYLFPQYVTAPFAPHHRDFWEWVWAIEAGADAIPFVGIWPRGGAKSTSVELAVAALGARRRRAYVLYVAGIQDRADDHVTNIGALLESSRVADLYPELGERLVNNFGYSKGWRVNRLRSASGFTVDAIGLDKATRGVKLDEQRPDLIIFDDIDGGTDSPKVTESKLSQITRAFLPALVRRGGTVLAMQNLVLPNGVFARIAGMAEAEADLLQDRILSGPLPAAYDLELGKDDEGKDVILGGRPIWEGQDLATMQIQLRRGGRTAFLIEAQHEVQYRTGGMFRAWDWMGDDGKGGTHWVDGPMEGLGIQRVRAWDTAGTEFTGDNDPDWTAGALIAYDPVTKRYRIESVERFRHASGTRNNLMRLRAEADANLHGLNGVTQLVEQRPGDLGRDEAAYYVQTVFEGLVARKTTPIGKKEERAEGLAAAMENGLVDIVSDDGWTRTFLAELEGFPLGDHDDMTDAAAHGFNWLRKRGDQESGTSAQAARSLPPLRR